MINCLSSADKLSSDALPGDKLELEHKERDERRAKAPGWEDLTMRQEMLLQEFFARSLKDLVEASSKESIAILKHKDYSLLEIHSSRLGPNKEDHIQAWSAGDLLCGAVAILPRTSSFALSRPSFPQILQHCATTD